jgi:hypothetical protein
MADADDTVELTDLEVIQQFSLAVRGAKARRADVIAALEADLAYLSGSRRAAAPAKAPAKSAPAKAPAKAPVKKATRSRA